MKKILTRLALFASLFMSIQGNSQTLTSACQYSTCVPKIGFNTTNDLQLYGALINILNAISGSSTISPTYTLNIKDNINDTLNARLKLIRNALYHAGDGLSITDWIYDIDGNKLYSLVQYEGAIEQYMRPSSSAYSAGAFYVMNNKLQNISDNTIYCSTTASRLFSSGGNSAADLLQNISDRSIVTGGIYLGNSQANMLANIATDLHPPNSAVTTTLITGTDNADLQSHLQTWEASNPNAKVIERNITAFANGTGAIYSAFIRYE